MPNAVWEYKLRPVEFVIFSYLCYHCSVSTLTPEVIVAGTHMTTGTVKKYLSVLADKGFIRENGTPALECEAGKFFTLPNEIFLLNLPPSAFIVYAYLLLIEDRRTHTCHPSYNTIAAETGLSKNTALKSVGLLVEKGLITVKTTSYFDKYGMKWKGNNLYTILPVRTAMDATYQRQLRQLELDVKRNRHRPRAALCASASAQAIPDPPPAT